MTKETAMAINEVSKRLTEVERKLDNYFVGLYNINANDITDVQLAMAELYEINNNIGGAE